MADPRVPLASIVEFLALKRIAMVGVSRRSNDFSRMLFDAFRKRGYEIVPVNPAASEILGQPCFARLQDVHPPVEAAILMTSPRVTESVVQDCAEARVRRVWMYSPGGGQGATSSAALEFCRAHNIAVIQGHCPFMFWRDSHFGHHLHGLLLRIMGHYPNGIHPTTA